MQNCCWLIKPITFLTFYPEIVESAYENKSCRVFFFSRDVEFLGTKKKQANDVYVAAAIVLDKAPLC